MYHALFRAERWSRLMPNFAANLTMLFTELDFLARFAAAKRSGFSGVEYLFPYAFPEEQLAEKLHQHNLTQVLHNLPAGNWDAGDRGIACHPDRVDEFQDGVGRAIDYARALGCRQINCLAGIAPASIPDERTRETFISNLKFAAPRLAEQGIKLLIEPINTYDIPAFFLTNTVQALAIMDEVGHPNIYLQYDLFHMQMMEGNLANTISKHLARIAHVQVADVPGRHEPGTGEINYTFLFKHLDSIGYQGWVGCEYKPLAKTEDGLAWLTRYERAVA
jgi:hydroxypyruvate isomerase